jgi:hypothetical protein
MFIVSEADAVAIRTVFEQEGELSVEIELRHRFPEITGNVKARLHAQINAGWKPPAQAAATVTPVPRRRPNTRPRQGE